VANRVLITNVPGPLSRPSLRALLTRPMIIILINYGIFCIHDITVSSIVPLFLAAPLKAGGLALSTGQIGFCLAMISFYNSVFQIFVFARMESRWGSKKLARGGMITMAVIYLIFPIHAWMAKSGSLGFMTWLLLLIQCTVLPFGLVGVSEYSFYSPSMRPCVHEGSFSLLCNITYSSNSSFVLWRCQWPYAVISGGGSHGSPGRSYLPLRVIHREEYCR